MTEPGTPGRHVAAAILVIAVTGLAAAPAQAAFPGSNGAIAFDRSVGESSYVHLARSDGTGVRRLRCSKRDPGGDCSDREPAWAPNGRRLAIANAQGIAVVDPTGKLLKQVVTEPPPDPELPELDSTYGAPAWSPSMRAIAFTDQSGDDTEVYIARIKDGHTRKLDHGPAEPAWSSRNRIALSGFGLITIWPDGKKPRGVFQGEVVNIDWSPGGRQIVFTNSDGMFTIKPNGRGRRKLAIGRRADPNQPVWAPDGRIIAWVDVRGRRRFLRALNRRTGRVHTMLEDALNPDWQSRPRR